MSTTPTAPTPFRILTLSAKNFKCIEALELSTKDGQPIVITGDNGAGKSSLLDSILFALTGKGTDTPLKKGEKRGVVTLDLGDTEKTFTVTRKFTSKDDSLILTQADESSVPKAQTVLNGMFSTLTIDPLAFMGLKATAQGEALKDILGVREVLAKLTQEEDVLFEKRKTVNARVKSLEGQVEGIKVAVGTPDQPVDVVALSGKIEEGQKAMAGVEALVKAYSEFSKEKGRKQDELSRAEQAVKRAEETLANAKKECARIQGELSTAEQQLADSEAQVETATAESEKLKPKLDAARQELANAQQINQAVADKQRRRKLSDELKTAEKEAEDLTEKITKKRDDKTAVVQNAKPPVEGLELTDDGLMYNGLPLDDQNTATQIRVCCALAMAEKPDVRILFIREGTLLSETNRQIVYDIAHEHKYQVWVEIVSDKSMPDSIHIVDGSIAENRHDGA